jgi:molecular chaperone DnaK (HSP70)
MSHGVYSVTTDGSALLNPDAVKLEPILGSLSQKQLLYIIWVYDYLQSPLRKKPLEDRRRISKIKFLPTAIKEFEAEPTFKSAIEAFKSFIYDEKYVTTETYKSKIYQMQQNLAETNATTDIKNITQTIDLLRKKIDELENSIDEQDQIIYVKGDRKLSLIEIWQRNKKHLKLHAGMS